MSVGRGLRWTCWCALTRRTDADGKIVWSRSPDAGIKFAKMNCERWWLSSPAHRGEREISRKPLRREGRIASAEPVCSCALCYVYFARETAGAARTRSSLRPPFSEGHRFAKLGHLCRGNANVCLAVIASDLSAEARRAKAEAKQSMPPRKERWIASSLRSSQ